ncbi:MAG: LptE family protein [Verrucomicrobiae bacterium]|nr:LptE family protein [Verrucomicrobiae bacterium]
MNRAARLFSTISLAGIAALGFAGCAGYQLGSVKPTVYQNIERIHVPTFENDTLEPRAESIVTNAVIKQLQQDGTYKITTADSADAVLKGKIRRIERRQLRASQTDTLKTTEMRLFMVIEWSLVDPKTGEKMAYTEARDLDETNVDSVSNLRSRPGRVVGETIQFIDPNFQLSERNAIPLAAQDAAQTLVGQLTNGF